MRPTSERGSALELLRPDSVEAAAAALDDGSVALAGGTEVVPLLRDGILEAQTLVQLDGILPSGVRAGWIGAGTKLAEMEAATQIPTVLREAASLAASPQLRYFCTLPENLLPTTCC